MSDGKPGESVPDLELSETQRAAIARLAKDEVTIKPPLKLARGAHLVNDDIERGAAADDPEVFWAERSELIEWIEPFHTVRRFELPHHEWFLGGKLNATANCIDRHVHCDRRNKAALIWVGEDGEEHHLHLQPPLPRGEPLRQRPAAPRCGQGRPGHHLHAARPRGDHHDARLRAHRRHPLGRFRRHGHPGAALAHRRLGRQGHRLLPTTPSGAARRSR